MAAWFGEYTKNHCIINFKWVYCMVYDVYLNIAVIKKKEEEKNKSVEVRN